MAERQFGPYRLVRQIAVGGMAEIHLAKTSGIAGFEKYVALKMIHPNFAEDEQFIQMLVDEAKIAVQLTHGNIAQTFDLGRVGDTYYITMEYVDGADLYKLLRRASEQDRELPLDVCAFVGKEIASALDHAHRKRDHTGRPLGIVHRDVSPQNVLISFAGEVKLVDFGIAKATMKARQTAVGVIKGKYYYMSPEQAWGETIDFRSDIFSAGIVLYEMLTGQMLYLEEDLHKLLDMARRADIAPPSRLRKGVPPQLERIVMHALQKNAGDRYQSAGDFATDLERFLHTYSPVFTAGKVAALMKQVLGDPAAIAPAQGAPPEQRDGLEGTMPIPDEELAHADDRDQLRDENSMIFRIADLKQPAAPEPARVRKPSKVMPSLTAHGAAHEPTALAAPLQAPSRRQLHEETRQLVNPSPMFDDAGTLSQVPRPVDPRTWDAGSTQPGNHDDLDGIGERTVITGSPGGMLGEDHGEATVITGAPDAPYGGGFVPERDEHIDDEEGPTMSRETVVRTPSTPRGKVAPPPALAANIQAPAVSELRKPRQSRRTPGGGNLLHQIVSSQPAAPMPAPPRAGPPPLPGNPPPPSAPPPPAPAPPPPGYGASGVQPAMGYMTDASGLPLAVPTPPGVPAHSPYAYVQGAPPGYAGYPPPPAPGMSAGALYQLGSRPMPPTLTAQMRMFEVDELPPQYRLDERRRRWLSYIVAAVVAISAAAIATFFILRATRDTPSTTVGSITVESVPPGADVLYDGTRISGTTPLTIESVPLGTRHEIRVELARHKAYAEMVDLPRTGGGVTKVAARLDPLTGKLVINTRPGGAEVWINGQLRGRTPTTINDLDLDSARALELRLKGYQPLIKTLDWPAGGRIDLDLELER